MIALEVSANGKPVYTVENADEFGSVSFNLVWSRVRTTTGRIVESGFMFSNATDVDDRVAGRSQVKIGDEMTIRLVETGADKPHA